MLLGREPLTLKQVSSFKVSRIKNKDVVRPYLRAATCKQDLRLAVLRDGDCVLQCALQRDCVLLCVLQRDCVLQCVLQCVLHLCCNTHCNTCACARGHQIVWGWVPQNVWGYVCKFQGKLT